MVETLILISMLRSCRGSTNFATSHELLQAYWAIHPQEPRDTLRSISFDTTLAFH
jgi:hypothetical protein